MCIVSRVNQVLQRRLECVLVLIDTCIDILLNLVKPFDQICRRLLIARWRILQVDQRRLKLESVIIVLQKSSGDGRIEGHARETLVGQLGGEGTVYSTISHHIWIGVAAPVLQEFTICPHAVD